MILSDSNIFIVEKLPYLDGAIGIYNLLEICGLASFNLTPQKLAKWFYHFDQVYKIKVLFPVNLQAQTAEQF